jgi:hypothetical protein
MSYTDATSYYDRFKLDPPDTDETDESRLFDVACENVTDEEIDEWLDNEELPRTDDNIEKAVTAIAMHRLGWDN